MPIRRARSQRRTDCWTGRLPPSRSDLMKASTIFVAVFLAVSPIGTAGAQSAAPDVKQDRPLEDPSESSPSNTPDPSRFGERRDEAFGAYQRGYYLTALELALPRAR